MQNLIKREKNVNSKHLFDTKKLKKVAKVFAIGLVCTFVLGLMGCADSEDNSDTNTSSTQPAPGYNAEKDQYKYLQEKENDTIQITDADYDTIQVLELTLRDGEDEGQLKLLFDFAQNKKHAWNMAIALTQQQDFTEEEQQQVLELVKHYGVADWENSYNVSDWDPEDGIWTMRVELADGQVAKYSGSLGADVFEDYHDLYDNLADMLMG